MKRKRCSECKELKPLSEFYTHKQMKDGRLNKCKSCKKKSATRRQAELTRKARAYDQAKKDRGESMWRCERCKNPISMAYCKGANSFPPKLCGDCETRAIREKMQACILPAESHRK